MLNRLRALWDRLIPTKSVTKGFSSRFDPDSFASTISVDVVHSIFSEAQQGQTDRLFSLYRDIVLTDGHTQAEFGKRKLAVLGDRMSLQPYDESSPQDAAAHDAVKAMVSGCAGFIKACSHALDSTLYPVSVLEKVFSPGGPHRYRLAELVPVPYQLLDYRSGDLRIYDVDPKSGRRLTSSRPIDPERYILHRGHLLTTPDNWGGPMRSLVFWWLLSMLGRDWFARHMERYASPFLLGRYNPDSERDRQLLESAFSRATRLFGLVVPDQTRVEILKATSSGGGGEHMSFHTLCQREKSKIILGQTISSEAQPTGLNSGVADLQSEVRQDIRQFDGLLLGETLREQLFVQYLQINGIPGQAPRAIWGSETYDDAKLLAEILSTMSSAGFQPTDSDLATISARIGFGIERKTITAGATLGLTATEMQSALGLSADNPTGAHNARAIRAIASSLACDRVAANGANGLAAALSAEDREIARIIIESHSPQDCERALVEHLARYRPGRAAELLESGMLAYTQNALSR